MSEVNPNMQYNSKPAPSGGAGSGTDDARMRKLQAVLDRFEITIAEANDLVILEDYEIVVIADDSGSMQGAAEPRSMRKLGQAGRSRWEEAKETVTEIVEIACCLDQSGIDVHFLNRPSAIGIKNPNDLAKHFEDPPRGGTPLTEVLTRQADRFNSERGILLFILTDGEPNGGKNPFIRQITSIVKNAKVRVQIMVCTAEDDEVEWLNGLDKQLTQVDVTDDYFNERAQVLRVGLASRFTRGDWCLKAMLGPVCKKFDQWDEKTRPSPQCELCSIM